uniref:Protein CNGC15c-like n=1 Tax=Cicer arietinum TaxID=3827 RepID=A0A3Q7Y074_CICAR|nr:protein CNGC15c-like [Cicer arietinum]
MRQYDLDEEDLLKGLPIDLRRDIKRHLCLDSFAPLFDQIDQMMIDAICERLKPALCTEGTCPRLRIGPGDFCGEELLTWVLVPRPSVILPSSTRTLKAISEVEAFALIAEDLKFVASQFRRLHSGQLRHKLGIIRTS